MTTTQLSEIYVQDYGAAGDGIADDTLALQAALTIGISAGKVIIFEAGKTYKTTAELRVGIGAGAYARLEGRGATISCNAPSPVRSVLAIINDVAIIQDLFATGNGTANSGIFLQRGSTSQFTNVHTYTTLVDGFTSFADNDRCHYKNCSARVCGQLFHTTGYAGPAPAYIRRLVSGTVAKTSGTSCIITGTDTYFLKTGARSGDFISMHAMSPGNTSAEWLQIHSVDSDTQISCKTHPASKGAASGLLYSIHVGDGYHEGPGRADNNINQIDNFLAENTAGAGIKTGGLYGVRVTNLQVNAAGSYPVVIASNDLQSIGSVFIGVYFELCAAANNFFWEVPRELQLILQTSPAIPWWLLVVSTGVRSLINKMQEIQDE
ncbi:MAG: hypothetical protein IPH22_08810 [Nitrosomonas sp.]|nr:hypothetical protein [Nitrosomonas sp.]